MRSFHLSIVVLTVLSFSINYCAKIPGSESIITTPESGGVNAKNINPKPRHSSHNSRMTSTTPPTSTEPILSEWGGNCTKKHWDKCSHLKTWVTSYYANIKKPELGFKHHEIDCTIQPPICLKNGWTVTKCQLLCMRCNREILSKYDKYVAKEGKC